MKSLPHVYQVQLEGGSEGYAMLSQEGLPSLQTAPPADFDGPGDAWSPEHLLMAAVTTCFLFTFRAVARASKLPFASLRISAEGTLDREDRVTRFTEIIVHPRLTLPRGADRAKALNVLEKSKQACLVSSSLSTPVRMQPEIVD